MFEKHRKQQSQNDKKRFTVVAAKQQFKEFGVLFRSTTVTNVSLPAELSQCLEEASKIDSQINEAARSQEFKMKQMNDQADLKLKQLTLDNEKQDADLIAKRERSEIEKDAKIAEAAAEMERALIQERQDAESRKVKATAALRDEQTRARAEVEKMLVQAEEEAKKRKLVPHIITTSPVAAFFAAGWQWW